MKKLVVKWGIAALSIYFAGQLLEGFHVVDWKAAFVAAFVLGLLNFTLKPILTFFTLPITFLTLGLFLLVINGIMIYAASEVLSGIQVNGFFDAVLTSIVISIATLMLNALLGLDKKKK